jgi:membrane protease YdiL (CAAX protease family)
VNPMPLLLLAGAGLSGAILWHRLAPEMRPLQPGSTAAEGVLYALAGWLGVDLLTLLAVKLAGLPDPPPFVGLVTLRAGAALLVAGLLLAHAARSGGVARLGLRRAAGPPAPLVAAAAWLAVLPAVMLLTWLNRHLLELLGQEPETQQWIADFLLSADARSSVLAWVAMAGVLPACEELFFRGGLYGGLRRALPMPVAVTLGALAFGLVHGQGYFIPTAGLGVALCLLYERTGSLAAPLCFHVLHNGFTLAIVSAWPEVAA